MSGDLFLLNLSYLLSLLLIPNPERLGLDEYLLLGLNLNLVWVVIVTITRAYDIGRDIRFDKIFTKLAKVLFFQILMTSLFIIVIKGYFYSRFQLLLAHALFIFFISIWRFAFLQYLKYLRSVGYNYRRVVVVGAGASGRHFVNLLRKNPEYGFKFLGFFDNGKSDKIAAEDLKGRITEVQDFAMNNKVQEIYCALPLSQSDQINELVQFCDNNLIRFKILPDFRGFVNKKVKVDFFDQTPVISIRPEPLDNLFNRFTKRVFDFTFSLLVVVLIFSWLFPIIALLIKLTSKGPVFFVQKRSGFNNETFWCLKFRTMTVNEDQDSKQATKGDMRITPLGRILRKTSLDELPQFLNVLLGNMSVVGPRPHMLKHTEHYSEVVDRFMVRHFVKPGITGLAQVRGYRGETTHPRMMEDRVNSDIFYVENWNFFLDIRIIIQTVINMVKGEENAV